MAHGTHREAPRVDTVRALLLDHLDDHYHFYGDQVGVRTARKHIIWYTRRLAGAAQFCARMNAVEACEEQRRLVDAFLQDHGRRHERLTEEDPVTVRASRTCALH
jgi:tRNA-dihydrouridine synthase B